MFGFLHGGRDNKVYRQVYAGCCRFQHARFGISTLPLLSYEAVFLYLLAIDAGQCSRPGDEQLTCCRLRRAGKRLHQVDPKFAEFASAFGLLLVSIKLEDDVRDDRSLLARLARWKLRKPIDWAFSYFSDLDASFRQRVGEHIERHLDLERSSRSLTIQQYAQPTADAFGYVVGLYQQLLGGPIREDRLSALGAAIGQSIISFDCAADWWLDRRRGQFNPLTDRAAVAGAYLESQRQLSRVAWQCFDDFGRQAVSASVAGATFQRVEHRARRSIVATESTDSSRSAARFSRKGSTRKGDCDCGCDPTCCCDPPSCDFDCPIHCHCPDSHGCHVIDCCPCDCCLDCDRQEKKKDQTQAVAKPVQPESRVGQIGHSVGPLNPSGIVEIHGQQCPAKSEFDWIEDNTVVEVVREEAFGVVVRPRKP